MVAFFGTRKSNGTELYQPENTTKFSIFFLAGSLALRLSTQMVQKFSFVSVKAGAKGNTKWKMVHQGGMCAMPDICI